MVMVAQCEDTLERIRKRAQPRGASLRLIYQLTRGQQSLERLRELVAVPPPTLTRPRDDARQFLTRFTRAFIAETAATACATISSNCRPAWPCG